MTEDTFGPAPERHVPTVDDFPETGVNALATFGQRAWARVVDTVIVYMPVALIALTASFDPAQPDKPIEPVAWLPFAWVAAALVYEVVAVSVWGTTIGKVALGTRIARFTDGEKPEWTQAFLRCLLPLAAAVTVFATLGLDVVGAAIVYLSSLANPLVRGWHDQAGGTIVIRTR